MAIQRTFSIIKPDATKRNLVGAITAKLEAGGLACHRAKADSI